MNDRVMTAAQAQISRDRVVEIAQAVCRAKQPDGKEGATAKVVADFLDHPKIDVLVDPVLPGRPNVIARVKGLGTGPSVLLNGHLDVKYAPGWSHDPHDPWIKDGKLYGGGISDMLGGVAALVAATEAAAKAGPLPGDLVLLVNMYHNSNGLGTKYALASDSDWPKHGINGEPTSLSLMTAHAGCVKFELTFKGRTGHVSRMEEAIDALAAAVDAYSGLRDLRFTHVPHEMLPGLPKLCVGVMQAGEAPGSVADRAIIRGDVRIVPGMSWHSVRKDLQDVIERKCSKDIAVDIGCIIRQRPFIGPTNGTLIESMRHAHRLVRKEELKINVDRGSQSFVTDAVDMAQAGIESVVYGPAEWHGLPDQFVEINEMVDAARVYLAASIDFMQRASGA